VAWFALTHPGVDAVAALVVVTWLCLSWPGVVGLATIAVVGLAGLRVIHPVWFARVRGGAVRDWLAWWFYRRRWKAAMTWRVLPRTTGASRCFPFWIGCTGPGRWTWCGPGW